MFCYLLLFLFYFGTTPSCSVKKMNKENPHTCVVPLKVSPGKVTWFKPYYKRWLQSSSPSSHGI